MNKKVINHYLKFGTYTNPGLYRDKLTELPDEITEIGNLLRSNFIHRTTLQYGNTGTNKDLKFGDMKKVPWYRQAEDDIFLTSVAMLGELYRRDNRGFISNRAEENKLILTCRYISILMASILKSKGIPARVRAGHAPYFEWDLGKRSSDHWINQYWSESSKKWITIDVDGSWSLPKNGKIDPYNLAEDDFDFAADAWLNVREGRVTPEYFWNAGGYSGLMVVAWSLFYDFHCLMNSEIPYVHSPKCATFDEFPKLNESELVKIDNLAKFMQNPDKNFESLLEMWETNKEFRLMYGGLL